MGNLRHEKEVRQLGGLMLILALAVMLYPIMDATNRITLGDETNPAITTDETLNLILIVGDICVVILGLLGMAIGLMALTDTSIVKLTIVGLVWEQTAFIDWIGKMYNLTNFFPDFETNSDQSFAFAMGVLKMFFLCFLLYGSLGLAMFNLYAFQSGQGFTKTAKYYRNRLTFYSFMYAGHGVFPFLVQGTKAYFDAKNNSLESPLDTGSIQVVGQPIRYPEMTMAVGAVLSLVGIWGMARGTGIAPNGDRIFQIAVGFAYSTYLAVTILTEFSISNASGMATTAAVVMINATVILAWLDEKARTVPEEMDEDYYDDDFIVAKDNDRAAVARVDDDSSSRSSGSRSRSGSESSEEIEAEGMA